MAGVADQQSQRRGMLFSDAEVETDFAGGLELRITVVDQDTIDELATFAAGEPRDRFALDALRIGVLALRHH